MNAICVPLSLSGPELNVGDEVAERELGAAVLRVRGLDASVEVGRDVAPTFTEPATFAMSTAAVTIAATAGSGVKPVSVSTSAEMLRMSPVVGSTDRDMWPYLLRRVLTGRVHRTGVACSRNRKVEVIRKVRVARNDRVDVRVRAQHDLPKA